MKLQKRYLILSLGIILVACGLYFNPFTSTRTYLGGSKEIKNSDTNLKIVTTIAVPGNIVENIVGSSTNITTIVSGTTDIHTFTGPTSDQLNKIYEADVIFAMGIKGAEAWYWDDVAKDNQSIIDKTVNLTSLADGYVDPLLGGSINPHVWMDPNVAKRMANITTSTLINDDPGNAATFTSNNGTFQAKLDQLLVNIQGNATILNNTKVVVNHPAFYYLLDLLGIERIAAVEEHEGGGEPGQAHINEIIQTMNNEGCHLIITNPQHYPAEAIEIARAVSGCKIADMSAIPGEYENWYTSYKVLDYVSMIEYCIYSLNNPGDPPAEEIPGFLPGLLILFASITIAFIIKRKNLKMSSKSIN